MMRGYIFNQPIVNQLIDYILTDSFRPLQFTRTLLAQLPGSALQTGPENCLSIPRERPFQEVGLALRLSGL
jgi:hypothetical protein